MAKHDDKMTNSSATLLGLWLEEDVDENRNILLSESNLANRLSLIEGQFDALFQLLVVPLTGASTRLILSQCIAIPESLMRFGACGLLNHPFYAIRLRRLSSDARWKVEFANWDKEFSQALLLIRQSLLPSAGRHFVSIEEIWCRAATQLLSEKTFFDLDFTEKFFRALLCSAPAWPFELLKNIQFYRKVLMLRDINHSVPPSVANELRGALNDAKHFINAVTNSLSAEIQSSFLHGSLDSHHRRKI